MLLISLLSSCTLKDQKVRNQVPELVAVKEIVCFVDSTNSVGIKEVANRSNLFKPYNGSEINYGQLRHTLWVRLTLENLTDSVQRFYISSDQVILEDVQFYSKTKSGWDLEKSGWGLAASEKKTPSYLHAFSMDFLPREEKSYFLRVKNEYQVVRLPIHIFSKKQFYGHYGFYVILDGLVIMALITSILYAIYNLTLSEKVKILYYYLLYAVSFLAFYWIRIASPAHISIAFPSVLNYYVNIFIFTSTYAFVKFGLKFMDPDKEDRNKKVEIGIDILFGLTVLVSLFPNYAGSAFFNSIKLTFFVCSILYLIWYMIIRFRKSLLTRIYFFMALPLVISGLVEGLTNIFGILKIPNQFFEAFRISICIEMLYLLFAYIYREKILTTRIQNKLKQTEFELLRSKIDSQEAEQKRIASDLHDELGGTLSTLKRFVFDNLLGKVEPKQAETIKKLAQKAGDDLRRVSHALMPPEFEKMGLNDSVKELVRSNNAGSRSFKFIQHGEIKKLTDSTELNIYRIVSEIIQNVNKHSSANSVLVQMLWSEDELTLMVEDNGSEFQIAHDGMGIKNMRMRAKYVGGLINFDSNKNGLTITLEVPINDDPKDINSG